MLSDSLLRLNITLTADVAVVEVQLRVVDVEVLANPFIWTICTAEKWTSVRKISLNSSEWQGLKQINYMANINIWLLLILRDLETRYSLINDTAPSSPTLKLKILCSFTHHCDIYTTHDLINNQSVICRLGTAKQQNTWIIINFNLMFSSLGNRGAGGWWER